MEAVLQHFLSAEGTRVCRCLRKRSPGPMLRPWAASQCTTPWAREAHRSQWLLALAGVAAGCLGACRMALLLRLGA